MRRQHVVHLATFLAKHIDGDPCGVSVELIDFGRIDFSVQEPLRSFVAKVPRGMMKCRHIKVVLGVDVIVLSSDFQR